MQQGKTANTVAWVLSSADSYFTVASNKRTSQYLCYG